MFCVFFFFCVVLLHTFIDSIQEIIINANNQTSISGL